MEPGLCLFFLLGKVRALIRPLDRISLSLLILKIDVSLFFLRFSISSLFSPDVASTSPPGSRGFVSNSWSTTSSMTDYEVEVVEIRIRDGELYDIIP